MFIVLINKENVLDKILLVTANRAKAENCFLEFCTQQVNTVLEQRSRDHGFTESQIDEMTVVKLTDESRDLLLDRGYEDFGDGVINFIDTDGPTSDAAIVAEILAEKLDSA